MKYLISGIVAVSALLFFPGVSGGAVGGPPPEAVGAVEGVPGPVNPFPLKRPPLTIRECIDVLRYDEGYQITYSVDPEAKYVPLWYARAVADKCWSGKVIFVSTPGFETSDAGDYIKFQSGGFTAHGRNAFSIAANVRLGTAHVNAFFVEKRDGRLVVDADTPYQRVVATVPILEQHWGEIVGEFPHGLWHVSRFSVVMNFAVGGRGRGVGDDTNPATVCAGLGYNFNPYFAVGGCGLLPVQRWDSIKDVDWALFLSMDFHGVYDNLIAGFTGITAAIGGALGSLF
jgi:hypothetical protein